MSKSFRVVAIISAFNEEDIISQVIRHLVENEIDVYLIDNRSTDNTVGEASRWLEHGLLNIEEFPELAGDRPPPCFDWTAILRRKEELALELRADWFIHHDADEIRDGPWPGLKLKEAIQWVDSLGYSAIDFRVVNFPPVDDNFQHGDDPRVYFRHFEFGRSFDSLQVKAWKAHGERVLLTGSGGHEVCFQGRRIFPIKFLLRHYPIRGQKHGVKKVLTERKNRFLESERSKGWHVQYDDVRDQDYRFIRDPSRMVKFDLSRARLELMLGDKIVRDLADRIVKVEGELDDLRRSNAVLEEELRGGAHGHRELEKQILVLQQREMALQHGCEEVRNQRDFIQRLFGDLQNRYSALEKQLDETRGWSEAIERMRAELGMRNQALEQKLLAMERSRSWRWTAPARRALWKLLK